MLEEIRNEVGEQVLGMLRGSQPSYKAVGYPGVCIHDACIVASILRPELFAFSKCRVQIIHADEERQGQSVTTPVADDDDMTAVGSAWVAMSVNSAGVFALIAELCKRYANE